MGCSVRNTQGVLGFLISVVSQTHAPPDIESREPSPALALAVGSPYPPGALLAV